MKEAIKKYLEETMVLVEGGKFMMGGDEYDWEKPIHKVELDSFWINKYPVIQELYEWVMGENPSYFKGKNRPVEQVDWYDAIKFCNTLSEKVGLEKYYLIGKNNSEEKNGWELKIIKKSKGYRLLTEAEWEYAARGCQKGNDNFFAYAGNIDLDKVGWYKENSHNESKEVGLKPPNQVGLYDMSGNTIEWCWDWYGNYKKRACKNPYGSKKGNKKVIRGGSWDLGNEICKVTFRLDFNPFLKKNFLGFRISNT